MTEAEMPIEMVKSTLGGALKNGPLRVPAFQREYSWKKDRVTKLFDDFANAMRKNQTSYFMGTVLLTPGRPPCIIDGQQRLATTTIFLAAVRDALLVLGKKKAAESVEADFLFMYDRQEKEDIPRLTLNNDDRAYIKNRVLARPEDRHPEQSNPLHSHRLIDQAARIAATRVKNIMADADKPSRKVDALNTWIEFIHHSAVIAMLTPPNAARAFQMYKSINDRAQRTTQGDMIKNHLFERAGDAIDEAQSKWSIMRTFIEGMGPHVGDEPLLTYLHQVSIVFNGPVMLEDIFERMEESVAGRADSLKFLEALAAHANDYVAIMTPDHPKWSSYDQRVRRWIRQISQQIKMTFIRPLMLAIAARFNPTETDRAFRMFVSWVVRFLIAGGNRGGVVEKAVGEAAFKVRRGEIATAEDVARSMVHVVPNDTRFQAAFCTKSLTTPRQTRFILQELEAQLRSGASDELMAPVEDTDKITLEHVLPLNVAAKGWEYYSDDERKTYRHRIGNQALMKNEDNGAIGDKPFAEKRPVMAKSQYIRLTADIITRTDATPDRWTTVNINERQKVLADLARQRWPLTFATRGRKRR